MERKGTERKNQDYLITIFFTEKERNHKNIQENNKRL